MIRFIRLLFYHIYIYYYKVNDGNKALSKFYTFGVFTVVFSFFVIGCNDIVYQNIDMNYNSLSANLYISIWVGIGIIIAYYLYREGFHDFNRFKDYHKKYYLYFFIIVISILCLVVYTGKTSRKRIFEQREIQQGYIEQIKTEKKYHNNNY